MLMCARILCLFVLCQALAGVAAAQTCPRPPADCAGALHCGGEWDFEAGFYFTGHQLAGQCAGPPGGGNVFCVPADKWAHIGVGWNHWASFPTWATGGYWGVCSFNENKNCDNVYRGNRSQELTMTCANGVGAIYKTAAVPAGHRVKVEAWMKFTPNGAAPDVEHAIGIDPSGGTNPAAASVQWTSWQEQTPSPPQPAGVFNRGTAEAVALGSTITVFIRQRAFEPQCQGQTFMIDHVKVFDLGVAGPVLSVQPPMLTPTAAVDTNPGAQSFTVANAGTGLLNYSIADDAAWLAVAPDAGSSTGEADTITVSYSSSDLSIGTHQGLITVTSPEILDGEQTVTVTLKITGKPGDLDGDGDVDQSDFGAFQRCFSGSGLHPTDPECEGADLDGDIDVDQSDFDRFQGCMSGAGIPSDANCLASS
ncbi:MAG: hypothetical protein AMXMBFR13_38000 [Phycisphaerae bacterium]